MSYEESDIRINHLIRLYSTIQSHKELQISDQAFKDQITQSLPISKGIPKTNMPSKAFIEIADFSNIPNLAFYRGLLSIQL